MSSTIETEKSGAENLEDLYELSPMQQGMLFHSLYAPESGAYFEQSVFTIKGRLDLVAFKRTWQTIVERHSILRTSFLWEGLEKPLQVVHRQVDLGLEIHDHRNLLPQQRELKLEEAIVADRSRGFDLSVAPVIRLTLFRLLEDEHKFLFSRHHLVLDRWSRALLLKEFFALYYAYSQGKLPELDSSPARYGDYIGWLSQQDTDAAENYWRTGLRGFSASIAFGIDQEKQRGARKDQDYASDCVYLSTESTAALNAFARRHKLTLNTLAQGAWSYLLSRYSGQDDVVFGVTVAGRPADLPGVESMIGLFLNTLPLRVRVPSEQPVVSWLQDLQRSQALLQQYQYSSLLDIQGWSEVPRGLPLFESIFVFENLPVRSSFQFPNDGLEIREDRGYGSNTGYPLTIMIEPGEQLALHGVYDAGRFRGSDVRRMLGHLGNVLQSIVADASRAVIELPLLTEQELRQILVDWNDTSHPYDKDLSIHRAFERQVALTPERKAIEFASEQLTYSELNARANQLAHYLRKRGVLRETLVAICVKPSLEMIVGLLGIMKAGGAYVPIDPAHPTSRVLDILKDTGAPLILTQDDLVKSLPTIETEVIRVDSDWDKIARESSEDLKGDWDPLQAVYVSYTSGSTGEPKGVIGLHQGGINRFDWMWRTYPFAEDEVCSQKTSLTFVDSFWEIFGPLLKGLKVVIMPGDDVKDPVRLVKALADSSVTRIVLVPSLLRLLLQSFDDLETRLPKLKYWTCSGETLPVPLAEAFKRKLSNSVLINLYGSSEVAADVTCHEVDSSVLSAIPIGRPIANTAIYLLDDYLRPVPPGVTGNLYVGGDNLARGYWNRGDLTAQTFMPNPYGGPGARMYRTGDLARFQEDGTIEYLGRADHQVKIRGFRVELGEIEAAMKAHGTTSDVVVLATDDAAGDTSLVCYVVPSLPKANDEAQLIREWRDHLRNRLPDYMVPRAFIVLDQFPLTASGKIHRLSLPAADFSALHLANEFVAPRNPREELLAGIWARVLGLSQVGVHDNFFELGGHSLLSTQVISRIREAFHCEVPLRYLFEAPTVAGLAEVLENSLLADEGLQAPPLARIPHDRDLPVSFAQQRLWFLDQLQPGSSTYNIPRAWRFRGHLNIDALSASLSEIVKRHESLRTTFVSVNGTPFQRVNDARLVPLPVVDLRQTSADERDEEARQLAMAETQRPFDLSADLLLRSCLLRIADDDHVLVLTIHHIAGDAWSVGILFHELAVLYEAFAASADSPLPEAQFQYADFAVWQRSWLKGEILEQQLSYWKRQLAGVPTVLKLPTNIRRPEGQSSRGARLPQQFSPELTRSLKELSQREGATLFMICLAAFQLLLSRYTGQKDLIVGTDVANRNRVETEEMIGFFVNLVPLRIALTGNPTFSELLGRAREVTLGAYTHQDLPFEKLVEELKPEREVGRNPLVQVLLVMQNAPAQAVEMSSLSVAPFELRAETSRFDLAVFLWEQEGMLGAGWLYNPDLFESSTIAKMSSHYASLLNRIVADSSARIDTLERLIDEEPKEDVMEKHGREQSQIKRLRGIRRRGVDLAELKRVKTGCFKPGETLPLVIEPDSEDVDLPEWSDRNREFLKNSLLQHGAILFRGFNIDSVAEFERFASSIGAELFGEYGDLPREEVEGKVYGSTPYPADETILFHNESSHMHQWPTLIWFCCLKAPSEGGETPIVDCRKIYQRLDPSIRNQFEQKGLMYVRNFTDGLDVSWQDFFHTTDKAAVESYCRKASVEFEWKTGNRLSTREICRAVVSHPQTGEKVFFNQLQLHHPSCLAPEVRESLRTMMKAEDLPRNVFYGDGSPIPDAVVAEILELYWQSSVSFRWQERDVLMVNNMLVAHARKPFVGPRKIVVAMADMTSKQQTPWL